MKKGKKSGDYLKGWLMGTPLGRCLYQQEREWLEIYLDNLLPQVILQMGANIGHFRLPETSIFLTQDVILPADVLSEIMRTPWQSQTFDAVWAAHTVDDLGDADEIRLWLAEMWRIVKPHGRLILTGFNPYSWWRWGAWCDVPDVSHSMALSDLKKMVESNGWKIEQGRFMNYLPPIQSEQWLKKLAWLEMAGNRWFPHGAAVYGLILRKDVAGITPTPELNFLDELADEPAFALARNEYKS